MQFIQCNEVLAHIFNEKIDQLLYCSIADGFDALQLPHLICNATTVYDTCSRTAKRDRSLYSENIYNLIISSITLQNTALTTISD